MKINNSLDVALWENIPCKCDYNNIEKCYPVSECVHCKCKECWDSVPQENFKVNTFDDEGVITGEKEINEITLVRGKIQDVVGWTW